MEREFLVTKFVCAACGSNLRLSYDMPRSAGNHSSGEPTGASMVRQLVAVEPCDTCMAPLQKLKNALATLSAIAKAEGEK